MYYEKVEKQYEKDLEKTKNRARIYYGFLVVGIVMTGMIVCGVAYAAIGLQY
jgi:hypothetical protein